MPFIAVDAFVGILGGFEPCGSSVAVLAHHTQLAVEQADAAVNRDKFARHGIIARNKIWGFAASDFKASVAHIVASGGSFGEANGVGINGPGVVGSVFGIKYAFTAKPGIINEVVLGVTNPRGSEHFGFIA